MKIAILGGGSWGTALALHLAKKKHDIKIWEFFPHLAEEMQDKRKNPLLPGVVIPKNIFVTSQAKEALAGAELILLVVPSDKAEETMKNISVYLNKQPLLICSKGFCREAELLSSMVGKYHHGEIYCFYGPTHAEEVSRGMLSGIVLAGKKSNKSFHLLKKELESENLRVELSEDIIGAQVASSLKNLLALWTGILSGAGYGDNTKAYVMTKGLAEIKEIGLKWGAEEETFYGLAGVGDIVVTCTSRHSRNFHVGEEVGKGRKLDDVLSEMKMVAEGVNTLKHLPYIKKKFGLSLPLLTGLGKVMFRNEKLKKVLKWI